MFSINSLAEKLKSDKKFWLVFTGDSITSCEWVHPNWREIVEYILKAEATKELEGDWKTSEWGIRTFNFAYDGATTRDILEKVNDVLLVKPDMVISLMGGNDLLFDIGVNEHIKNIENIINEILDARSIVAWCTSTPSLETYDMKKNYEKYAKATMEIKFSENVQLIDMFSIYGKFQLNKFFTFKSEGSPKEGLKMGDIDPTHPNQLGNAYIAKVILKHVFDITFDPEKYIKDALAGEKLPGY